MDDYDNCMDPECPGPGDAEAANQEIAARDEAAGRTARPMTAEEGAIIGETLFAPLTVEAETARAKWAWAMAEKEI